MGYALPTNTGYVSCSWQCHRDRPTPSSEPGTDYGSAYGSPLYAVEAGKVFEVKTSNSAATGRFITIDLDDGRRTRSLHLSEVWVHAGQRVSRGQQIGKTGASGYDSDWGYGAHVHQTLWAGHYYAFGKDATLDFEKYVGGSPTPTPPDNGGGNDEEDEEMGMKGAYYTRAADKVVVFLLFNEQSGFWVEHSGVPSSYNNTIANFWQTGSWAPITESHSRVIKTALNTVRQRTVAGDMSVDISSVDAAAASGD